MKSKVLVLENINIKKSFQILNKTAKKTLVVVDNKKKLLGTLSNGDLRKALLKGKKFNSLISDIYKKKCIKFYKNKIPSSFNLKNIFIKKGIDLIPIVNSNEKIVKILYPSSNYKISKKIKILNFYSVIMAGGLGTRLQPFTHILPKPLIPVNKKPIIEHIINKLRYYKTKKIFITVNYKSKILKAFFDELKPRLKVNLIQEKKPLGTCGSIKKIKFTKDYPILLSNCDTLINFNIQKIIEKHLKTGNDFSVLITKKDFIMPYGVCEFSRNKNLVKIIEKPKYTFNVNTGVYVFNKNILQNIPTGKKFDTTDLISKLISKDKKIGIISISEKNWKDFGEWKSYLNK